MKYAIRDIASIIGARFLNQGIYPGTIEHPALDSRQILFPDTALFFALRGRRLDGHDFISEVYAEGVRHFVISRPVDLAAFPQANFLLVNDGIHALQLWAGHHRQQFAIPVIGITGSNGKTIVKEWLFQLLQEDFHIVRSPKSYNSQTGVPLSVLQIQPDHELAIFEAGISRMNEMERLAPVIRCSLGLFTNIGEAHSEGFPSLEEKLRQKLQLFDYAGRIFFCKDDQRVAKAVEKLGKPVFSWSYEAPADLQILATTVLPDNGALIEGLYRGQSQHIRIPFSDPASIENAIHCWAVLLHLGLPENVICRRMGHLEPVAMRLELKAGINGCTLINDSYNSDLTSLTLALHFLQQQSRHTRRTLILSDILQSGRKAGQLYEQVAGLVKEIKIDRLFGIGPQVQLVKKWLPAHIENRFFPDTASFLKELEQLEFQEETILLKGARPFAFERIAGRLSKKAHHTVLEVHLNALAHNLGVYHQQLSAGVKLMVMVKAAAYGTGSEEVARMLEFHKVDYLAVAYADEGVELRRAGITLPVLVLNSEDAVFDSLVRYRLEPEIYHMGVLKRYANFLGDRPGPFPVHIKLDTGMHRLGFEEADLASLIDFLLVHPELVVQSVFSHLASSEDPEHDEFTHQQVDRFQGWYDKIVQGLGYRPMRHILNSSGISRFPQYQMEMVRLGIGMYGIDASESKKGRLQVVLTLKATISQIKSLRAGETVGYGRKGVADRPMQIATISLGYADGFLRAAGNGRYSVLVRGQRAPTIGNICMDMSMIDISHVPEARVGDEVIIFGEDPRVEELAGTYRTIPYEVFTGISPRVKRVYIQE